ncbi:MAG TPA: hypothetical protein VK629_20395, partial [Steroidobacteraceae bacterium]|nr:hypothetical protein [Steroidobacteraceae bacterium]
RETIPHQFHNARIDRRRGCVIEIDRSRHGWERLPATDDRSEKIEVCVFQNYLRRPATFAQLSELSPVVGSR